MTASSLIQLIAACIGIIGSLFFAIGVMRQSIEAMARLSASYWDSNPHMPAALAAQKADYLFGGCLIVIAFALQLFSFFAPTSTKFLNEHQAELAPWIAAVLVIASFLFLRAASQRLASRYETQIKTWLKQNVS